MDIESSKKQIFKFDLKDEKTAELAQKRKEELVEMGIKTLKEADSFVLLHVNIGEEKGDGAAMSSMCSRDIPAMIEMLAEMVDQLVFETFKSRDMAAIMRVLHAMSNAKETQKKYMARAIDMEMKKEGGRNGG